MVGLLEVFVGMNLLSCNSYRDWLKGRQKNLDVQIQGGPKLHKEVIVHFGEWLGERGLQPLESSYTIPTRSGTKRLQVFEEYDEVLEKLFCTRYAPPEAKQKLSKKLEKKRDLVVIISTGRSEKECAGCTEGIHRGEMFIMEDAGPLCLSCADMDHLSFLPSGDAALTRRSKKYSPLSAVVVEFSRSRKRYERQGLLVAEAAITRAEEECIKDADEREERRQERRVRVAKEDEAFRRSVEDAIRERYPHCPAAEAKAIARHTTLRGSGRVGRSAAARELDADALRLAVVAYIRHEHTNYDELLMSGAERADARSEVRSAVSELLARWEGDDG